jgi:hypothetical protein
MINKVNISGFIFQFSIKKDKLEELMATAVLNNQFYPLADFEQVNDLDAFDYAKAKTAIENSKRLSINPSGYFLDNSKDNSKDNSNK